MIAAGGGLVEDSRSTLMGVLLVRWMFVTVSITVDGGVYTVVERDFFGGGVLVGSVVVAWRGLLLELGGGGLRVGLEVFLVCLLGRAMVSR